ncbi:hypothetical protein B0T24DRAFT_672793 [Lasiosphaeria ovina]|uniref:CFEM domain-containing protein n=1 Tax=Lasiosphaeria ovina TaxID=92902 RepID=A0AAE0NJR9_9PEZI|nr:hypothetical protein B0T24DRAFT_672793 [Lasiosphaeria ovina]
MRLSSAQLVGGALLLATRASSQLTGCAAVAVEAIPGCAQSCFIDGAPTIGCGGFDFACQCAQEAAMYAAIEGCVASSCEESEAQNVIDGATKVCECALGGFEGGSQSSQTVSGTLVRPSQTASFWSSSNTVLPPSNTLLPSSIPSSISSSPTSESGDGGGGIPTTTPTYFAISSSSADRQSIFGLGLAWSIACAVAFAFVAL